VACGNRLIGTAAPLPAAANGPGGPDWEAIARVIREYRPARLVVGVPPGDATAPGSISVAAQRFAAELARRHALPVTGVDEHLSSREAEAELKAQRASGERTRRVQKADIDSLAAALILERWLAGRLR
jgi:putative Holliday junction resolvase